jgi:hypothetical protein
MPKSNSALVSAPTKPKRERLNKSHMILSRAHAAAAALLTAFDASRTKRRATGGQTTDAEQDLLRAMLVFAGAGLDSTIKQLLRDTLATMVKKNENARASLAKYAARKMRDEATSAASAKGFELIATALASGNAQATLIDDYVQALTGESLQSTSQLNSAIAALGLAEAVTLTASTLKPVFDARNQIAHEMDVLFSGNRKRRSRQRDTMIQHTNKLLDAGSRVLAAADAAMTATRSSFLLRTLGLK